MRQRRLGRTIAATALATGLTGTPSPTPAYASPTPAAATAAPAGAGAAVITTVAGAPGLGPARDVGMQPSDVAVIGDTLYVADSVHRAIRAVDLTSGVATVVADLRPDLPTSLGGRTTRDLSLATDGADLYVASKDDRRIQRLTPAGLVPVAGDGVDRHAGDGGPAIDASFVAPYGMAFGPDGALYVADGGAHVVRRIDPDGTITTVAGTPGVAGYDGDDGPATAAHLDSPADVAVSAGGRLAIADGNRVLREVVDGRIRTVFGSPGGAAVSILLRQPCTAPDDRYLHAPGRVMYEGESILVPLGCMWRVDPDGTVTRITEARPHGPYRCDNGTVRTETGVYAAGNAGVCRDHGGTSEIVAGLYRPGRYPEHEVTAGVGAPARSAQIARVTGVDVAPDGSITYIDAGDAKVLRIAPDTSMVSMLGGIGAEHRTAPIPQPPPGSPYDDVPSHLHLYASDLQGGAVAAEPSGSVLVLDGADLARFHPDGALEPVVAGSAAGCTPPSEPDGGLAMYASLRAGVDVEVAPEDGSILVLERGHRTVRRIRDGRIATIVGSPERDHLCRRNGFHPALPSPLWDPTGLAVGEDDTLYVVGEDCLYRVESQQEATCLVDMTRAPGEHVNHSWHERADLLADVEVAPDGAVVFTDPWGHTVKRWKDGAVTVIGGDGRLGLAVEGSPATATSLAYPTRLAIGDDGQILVTDAGAGRLYRIAPPGSDASVLRLSGLHRFRTAVETSRARFDDGEADAVVLARADDYADALAGGPLAVANDAPLLLTDRRRLTPWTESELRRVLPPGGRVILLGGPAALGAQVERRIRALGYRPERISGLDRFETATRIADALGPRATAVLVRGDDFPDAVSGGAAAAASDGAVLLTAGAVLPSATADWLAANPDLRRVAVGGPAARADETAEPVVGRTRYETAVAVAARFFPAPSAVGVATGRNFPDALAAVSLLGEERAPLLLADGAALPSVGVDYLRERPTTASGRVFGGPAVLAPSISTALERALDEERDGG